MLNDQSVMEILGEWSFWSEPPTTGLTRQLELPQRLHHDIALIIQGVRVVENLPY